MTRKTSVGWEETRFYTGGRPKIIGRDGVKIQGCEGGADKTGR